MAVHAKKNNNLDLYKLKTTFIKARGQETMSRRTV